MKRTALSRLLPASFMSEQGAYSWGGGRPLEQTVAARSNHLTELSSGVRPLSGDEQGLRWPDPFRRNFVLTATALSVIARIVVDVSRAAHREPCCLEYRS